MSDRFTNTVKKIQANLDKTRSILDRMNLATNGGVYKPETYLLTSKEAKDQYDIDLPDPNYMLKVYKDAGRMSYVTPSGWQYFDEDTIIDPQGRKMTRQELEQQYQSPILDNQDIEQTIPETGITQEDQYLHDIFGEVLQADDINEALNIADTNPQQFYEMLWKSGRNDRSERVVREMFPGITEEQINELFTPAPGQALPQATEQQPQDNPSTGLNFIQGQNGQPGTIQQFQEFAKTDPDQYIKEDKGTGLYTITLSDGSQETFTDKVSARNFIKYGITATTKSVLTPEQAAQQEAQKEANKSWWDKPLISGKAQSNLFNIFGNATPSEILKSPELNLALLGAVPTATLNKVTLLSDAIINAGFGAGMAGDTYAHRNDMTTAQLIMGFGLAGLGLVGGGAQARSVLGDAAYNVALKTANNAGYKTIDEYLGSEAGFAKVGKGGTPKLPLKKFSNEINYSKLAEKAKFRIKIGNEYTFDTPLGQIKINDPTFTKLYEEHSFFKNTQRLANKNKANQDIISSLDQDIIQKKQAINNWIGISIKDSYYDIANKIKQKQLEAINKRLPEPPQAPKLPEGQKALPETPTYTEKDYEATKQKIQSGNFISNEELKKYHKYFDDLKRRETNDRIEKELKDSLEKKFATSNLNGVDQDLINRYPDLKEKYWGVKSSTLENKPKENLPVEPPKPIEQYYSLPEGAEVKQVINGRLKGVVYPEKGIPSKSVESLINAGMKEITVRPYKASINQIKEAKQILIDNKWKQTSLDKNIWIKSEESPIVSSPKTELPNTEIPPVTKSTDVGQTVTPQEQIKASVEGIKPPEQPPKTEVPPENPDDVVKKFVDAINSEQNLSQVELDKRFVSQQKQQRIDMFGKIIDDNPDLSTEEALNKAKGALSGQYERKVMKLGDMFSDQERAMLFDKVSEKFPNKTDFEYLSHAEALRKALDEGIISDTPGVKGGSQRTRLEDVFGKKFVDALQEANHRIEKSKGSGLFTYDPTGNLGLNPQAGQLQFGEMGFKAPASIPETRTPAQLAASKEALKAKYDLAMAKLQKPSDLPPFEKWDENTLHLYIQAGQEKLGTGKPTTNLTFKDTRTPAQIETDLQTFRTELAPNPQDVNWYNAPKKTVSDQLKLLPPTAKERALDILKRFGVEATDALNIPRAFITSFDISAPGRQGLQLVVSHPVSAGRNFIKMFKSLATESGTKEAEEYVNSILRRAGERARNLYIAPLEIQQGMKGLSEAEETFMSKIASKIPGVKQSQRAYVTFLNTMRADVFNSGMKLMEKTPTVTLKEYDALANLINAASGRGTLPKQLATAAPVLNALLFSPRYMMSRLEYLPRLFQALKSGNSVVALEGVKELSAFLTFGGSVLGIYKLSGGELELDPRSAEFGKIRIGQSKIDVWAGYLQYVRFLSRLITGETKTATGEVKTQSPGDTILSFIQSKESPAFGLLMDILSGKSYSGDEMALTQASIKKQAFDRLVPLFIQDMVESLQINGTVQGITTGTLSALGIGVVTYDSTNDDIAKGFNEDPTLKKLDIQLGKVGTSLNGIELTKEEQEKYQLVMADMVTGQIQDALANTENLPDEERKKALEKYISQFKDQAKAQYIVQNPEKFVTSWNELTGQLGQAKYTDAPDTVEQPVYDTSDLYSDINTYVGKADYKDSGKLPQIVQEIVKAKDLKDSQQYTLRESPYKINSDISKGDTYVQYYKQWQERQRLEGQPDKLQEFDAKYPNAKLGNITRTQYSLLEKYNTLDDAGKKQYLKDHPELKQNPYEQYLLSNPNDNAQLAIFGQAKVMSKKAYDKVRSMMKDLDIPDNAVQDLPPEDIAEAYYKYQDAVRENGAGSPESKKLLIQDDKLREYLGIDKINIPEPVLDLQIKNKDIQEEYNALFTQNEKDDFLKNPDNQEFADDLLREEAYKDTFKHDGTILDTTIVEDWVRYSKIENSDEKTLFRLDNVDFNQWGQNVQNWKQLNVKNEDVLRIKVENQDNFDQYNSQPDDNAKIDYLFNNQTFAEKYYKSKALENNIPATQVQNYIDRNIKVLNLKYLNKELDDQYDAIPEPARQKQFLIDNPEYADRRTTIQAINYNVPDQFLPNYVQFSKLSSDGYDREWYLQENKEYYEQVYLAVLGKEVVDFNKVPTRKWYYQYKNIYLKLDEGQARTLFRKYFPEFNAEGVRIGKWKDFKK